MKKDELIDKILSDLYLNSNRGMDFYDDFCVYENDINKLEEVKNFMEREGLIKNYNNLKTGITPLGFKICFEGGYLETHIKKERQIRHKLNRNAREINSLKKKLKSSDRINTVLLIAFIFILILSGFLALGLIDFDIKL